MSDDVTFLSQLVRDSMELQAQDEVRQNDGRESNVMKPLQVLKPHVFCNLLDLLHWMGDANGIII